VRSSVPLLITVALLAACGQGGTGASEPTTALSPPPPPSASPSPREAPTPPHPPAPLPPSSPGVQDPAAVLVRPEWLGTRVLPLAADGFGERLPTPDELLDRRLGTPPLPAPAPAAPVDDRFTATIAPVPDHVLARSTWRPGCPVTPDELQYLTVTFLGFDGRLHTGELIVNADVATDVVGVFAALHAARFPLEEVRVIAIEELSAPPTGDGNVTSAFVCRPAVGATRWSEHAYGRAVDVNPFHNPYVRGDLVLPELAGAYVDRSDVRPGMIVAGDAVTSAFAAAGWAWGGAWTGTATDPMHFSRSGR
jgi:hypothetical protein